MRFDYLRGEKQGNRQVSEAADGQEATEEEEESEEGGKGREAQHAPKEDQEDGEVPQEDIDDLVAERDSDGAGGSEEEEVGLKGRSSEHCRFVSAETGSVIGLCRTLMAFKLDHAGQLGKCSGACGHINCVQVQLIGVKASNKLIKHQQSNRDSAWPLACVFRMRRQEVEEETNEHY
jgi:hypothetical protein